MSNNNVIAKNRAIGRAQAMLELAPDNTVASKYGLWLAETKTWYDNEGDAVTLSQDGSVRFLLGIIA